MRAKNADNENAKEFSDDLLKVGAGTFPQNEEGLIDIRSMASYISTEDQLIAKIYPELYLNLDNCNYFSDRAILSFLNDEVDRINIKIMETIPGDFVKLESIDETINDGDCVEYPVETLNSFKPSGFPDSSISVKLGVPIMIIKNMGHPDMVNGTRVILHEIKDHILIGKIVSGVSAGQTVFIPKFPFISDEKYPVKFKRLQFPIRGCLAMTVNKSQGQTIKRVGVDLWASPFTHGQLYVALSRGGKKEEQFYTAATPYVKNVVFKEVL